jgi:triacylglycerol lipase
MNIVLILFLIPFLYCLITLIICSIFDVAKDKKKFVFPISSLLYESFLQVFVFLSLPIDFLRRWDTYESTSNKFAVLLPGYSETQFVFWNLRRNLKKNNIGYKTIKYKPFFGDLTKHAKDLKMEIDVICNNNCEPEIYIIGHSMGGLIGRYFLENNNYTNVCYLIMIATPHNGTILGKLGIGECANQLIPNSNFLNDLSDKPIVNSMNLYSNADSLICPRDSAIYMKNNFLIKNKPLHNSTLFKYETINLIIERIRYGKCNSTN